MSNPSSRSSLPCNHIRGAPTIHFLTECNQTHGEVCQSFSTLFRASMFPNHARSFPRQPGMGGMHTTTPSFHGSGSAPRRAGKYRYHSTSHHGWQPDGLTMNRLRKRDDGPPLLRKSGTALPLPHRPPQVRQAASPQQKTRATTPPASLHQQRKWDQSKLYCISRNAFRPANGRSLGTLPSDGPGSRASSSNKFRTPNDSSQPPPRSFPRTVRSTVW